MSSPIHQSCGDSFGRTFEDVEEAAGPGGIFGGHRNNSTISAEAYFSLMHRLVKPDTTRSSATQPPRANAFLGAPRITCHRHRCWRP